MRDRRKFTGGHVQEGTVYAWMVGDQRVNAIGRRCDAPLCGPTNFLFCQLVRPTRHLLNQTPGENVKTKWGQFFTLF
jgi:hypothetical protein